MTEAIDRVPIWNQRSERYDDGFIQQLIWNLELDVENTSKLVFAIKFPPESLLKIVKRWWCTVSSFNLSRITLLTIWMREQRKLIWQVVERKVFGFSGFRHIDDRRMFPLKEKQVLFQDETFYNLILLILIGMQVGSGKMKASDYPVWLLLTWCPST